MPQEPHCRNEQPGNPEPPSATASSLARSTIRLPQNRLARICLGCVLLIHFFILFLNNLAWSPAIASVWPIYAPYVGRLGLVQDWSMYQNPHQFDQQIKIEAFSENGSHPIPQDNFGWASARMLYFVEGLCIRNSPLEASIYLGWLFDRTPKELHQPTGLVLQRKVRQIRKPNNTKTRPTWRTKEEFFFWSR